MKQYRSRHASTKDKNPAPGNFIGSSQTYRIVEMKIASLPRWLTALSTELSFKTYVGTKITSRFNSSSKFLTLQDLTELPEPHLLWSSLVWSPTLCLGYGLGSERGHWYGIYCLSIETTCCEGLFWLQSWIRYERSFLRTGIDSTLPGSSHCLWRVQALPKKSSGCQKRHLCVSWKASAAKGTDSKLLGKGSQKNPLQSSSQTFTFLQQHQSLRGMEMLPMPRSWLLLLW